MATHHVRHPLHHSKKPLPLHARSSRPAPSHPKRTHCSKPGLKPAHSQHPDGDGDDDAMAVSFLNYW